MCKRSIVFVLLTLVVLVLNAAKAGHVSREVTLTDGTVTTITLQGDEHVNFFLSAEGDIVLSDGEAFRKATAEEVADIKARCMQVEEENQQALAKLMAGGMSANSGEKLTGTRMFPHMGTPRVPVIVVQFQDTKLSFGMEEYDKMLNSSEYNKQSGYVSYSSVAEYFNFCSNGKFRPQFELYGPYTMSGNTATYGAGNDNMSMFIPEACKLADADINYKDYDQDGDGYCDLVYVLYAGYGANMTSTTSDLWPKSGSGPYGTFDGVQIYRYGISNELLADRGQFSPVKMTGIGVFCHEFSHTMGMPDFYPTSSWTDKTMYNNQSMEEWSVMDGGENNYGGCYPTPYTAWERELMGWTDKMPVLEEPSDVTLTALQNGGTGLRVKNDADAADNEYYVLENVPKTGWYYRMPNNGMIVTHVNYDVNQFSNFNHPNNTQGSPRITVMAADGLLLSSYMINYTYGGKKITYADFQNEEKGDPYPGSKNVTSLTDWKNYIGSPMDKPITDIALQEDGTVTFRFMGGTQPTCGDPIISYENGKLNFLSETEGVTYHYTIAPVADAEQTTEENYVVLHTPEKYVVSVYASKEGFLDSKTVTKTVEVGVIADVNRDGSVNMTDANIVVNMYLGNTEIE